jgi:hypothetical protein
VDALPTLTDVDSIGGQRVVTTPANFYHMPAPDALLETGRLDELDSVARESPSLIGFAFNNRLLFGGFGGEPQSTPGSLNPFNDPAGENITLLLLDAHRMLNFQSAEILKIPAFVKLFRDAFPDEAAQADAMKDLTLLVNDMTEFRAQATFLRTVVTRNTPFDRFLAGDDRALTPAQRRGATLFFTPAANGAGGAGCFSCHSGPMLNKQPDDPDVAGIGAYVRALTLRQLKDGRNFFHNGSFTKVRNAVEYFNAGVPQDRTAGASPTLSTRFTNLRGLGYPNGLGLTEQQVDDLTDFLENALYDPAFVNYDPASGTDTLQPNEHDLTYSKYRPDLAALGAKDGLPLSGLAIDDNDTLARRDQGLEFLDVTSQLEVKTTTSRLPDGAQIDQLRIANSGPSPVDTHLLIIVRGLSGQVSLENASGKTHTGDPYIRVFLHAGILQPDHSIQQQLIFTGQGGNNAAPVAYVLNFLSGQGNP